MYSMPMALLLDFLDNGLQKECGGCFFGNVVLMPRIKDSRRWARNVLDVDCGNHPMQLQLHLRLS